MSSSSPKKVLIRTDANAAIASGHVMRCLSVADALRSRGADVEFVLSDGGPVDVIRERGYEALVLGVDWRKIEEGIEILEDRCLRAPEKPVVLVDTYSVTGSYVNRLSRCCRVCYLGSKAGDLGDLALLANYSTDVDMQGYETIYGGRGTRLLLGPSFAPLRAQFADSYKARMGKISRVLVTTGNTDPMRFVPIFLNAALKSELLDDVSFAVVVGGMFADASEIEGIASAHPRVELHRSVSDMAKLMMSADVAVSANGTTVYEMAAVGLPAVTFAMVEEQVPSAESLARLDAIAYAGYVGDAVSESADRVLHLLEGLVSDPGRAHTIALCAHRLIDGRGADRIAKEIIAL